MVPQETPMNSLVHDTDLEETVSVFRYCSLYLRWKGIISPEKVTQQRIVVNY